MPRTSKVLPTLFELGVVATASRLEAAAVAEGKNALFVGGEFGTW